MRPSRAVSTIELRGPRSRARRMAPNHPSALGKSLSALVSSFRFNQLPPAHGFLAEALNGSQVELARAQARGSRRP